MIEKIEIKKEMSTEKICAFKEKNSQGQKICSFLRKSCLLQNNLQVCELPDYYLIPGHCPNCYTYNSCNQIKARLCGKDYTLGWICKNCLYYIIFPLNPIKEELKIEL